METDNITHPLFPDPNNGTTFVPESETTLAGLGEWSGFLLVRLKMADKKGGKKNLNQLLLANRRTVKEGLITELEESRFLVPKCEQRNNNGATLLLNIKYLTR
jgi:hypothetical protein